MKRLKAMLVMGTACGGERESIAGPNCGDIGVPAVTLIALDAGTRQPLTGQAMVIARDGTYADTAIGNGAPTLYGMAYNRPGIYTVTVDRLGYRSWRVDNIVVVLGRCSVTPVPLAAFLASQ